MKHFIYYYY